MSKGRGAIQLAIGWSNTHAAEEWLERQLDSRSEGTDHALAIEGDDPAVCVGILHRQEALAEKKAVAREIDIEIDLQDLNLEHISGLGLGDRHRPGQNMASPRVLRH